MGAFCFKRSCAHKVGTIRSPEWPRSVVKYRRMSKRLIHSLLTLIFAFLQCMSPLVHAHTEGEQSGMLHVTAAVPAQLEEMDGWSTDDAAIISLTDDIHRYAQLALPPAPLSPLPAPPLVGPTSERPYLAVIRIQRATCCTPPSQAPPVLS